MHQRPGHSTQLCHHHVVPRSYVGPQLFPAWPISFAATDAVRKDFVASGLLEGIELRVELLVRGADPGITNFVGARCTGHETFLIAQQFPESDKTQYSP